MTWNSPEVNQALRDIADTPIEQRKYKVKALRDAMNGTINQPATLFNQEELCETKMT